MKRIHLHRFKMLGLIMLMSFFSACNDENSNQKVTTVVDSKNDEERPTPEPIPREENPIKVIHILNSEFKEAYSLKVLSSLYSLFQDPRIEELFLTKISDEDLDTLKCKNFNQLNQNQKTIFYLVYLSAIVELESDFNPNETTYDSTHRNLNIGLLQIDTDTVKRHAYELISDQAIDLENMSFNLKEPLFNLNVGLFILRNQITGKFRSEFEGRLLSNSSYYWEVLNSNHRSKFLWAYNRNYSNLSFCEE
jgi:hypothetical protein